MAIKHNGCSILHSHKSNTSFNLQNLMHVPNLTKNLISVLKFAHDKHVFFEFHYNVCYVESQIFKGTLL